MRCGGVLAYTVPFCLSLSVLTFSPLLPQNIAAGQVPGLLGISKLFDTKAATYKVIINTLKFLPHTKLDAAFGIPALFG